MADRSREIAWLRGEISGPTLIVTTVIHGNETAGIRAAERVLEKLRAQRTPIAGDLLVLGGNLSAMAAGKRYHVKDLNRQWTDEKVAALRARDPALDDEEDREQRALLAHLDRAIAYARGPVYAVDLHTTSASGYAFGIHERGDAEIERFASRIPLPMISGLAAALAGVLTSWLVSRGVAAIAVEGGQHDAESTVDHLEAALWCALASAGVCVHAEELARATKWLEDARGAIPRAMQVVARYAIHPGDEFHMAPGFANIAHVKKDQLLARDGATIIRAPTDGLVILPLYQKHGDDGFFFGRELKERARRSVRPPRR